MTLRLGNNTEPEKMYLGSNAVSRIYKGSEMVWEEGGDVLAQTAIFPAATPALKGGFKPYDSSGNTVDLTSVSDQTGATRTWSISGGALVASDTPGVDDGVVITCLYAAGEILITIDSSTYDGEAIVTPAELHDLAGSSSRLSGRTHIIRNREYDISAYNFYSRWSATSEAIVRAERTDIDLPTFTSPVSIAGATIGLTKNITFEYLRFHLVSLASRWHYPDPYAGRVCVAIGTASFIKFDHCRFSGDLPDAGTGGGGYPNEDLKGFTIQRSEDITLTDCEFDHLWIAYSIDGTRVEMARPVIHAIYADFMNLGGSNSAEDVHIWGWRAYDMMGWGSLIHSDICQWNRGSTNITIEGGVFCAGAKGLMRPGIDPVTSSVALSGDTLLTEIDHAGKNINAPSGSTVTLPLGSSVATDAEFIIYAASGSITVTASGSDTYSGGSFPLTVNTAPAVGVRWDGSQWVPKQSGTRTGVNVKTVSQVVPVWGNKHESVVDTRFGDLTLTCPASPSSGDWFAVSKYAVDSNKIIVEPNVGQTLYWNGGTVASFNVTEITNGKKITWDGAQWVITDLALGNQGFFSNSYTFSGEYRIQGNILDTMATWNVRIESTEPNQPAVSIISHNAFLMRGPNSDWNGDGAIGPADGSFVFGTEGTIETRNYTGSTKQWIVDRNLTNNIAAAATTDEITTEFDNDEFGITLQDSLAGDYSKITTKLAGASNGWAVTINEQIAAAILASGYRSGEYFGPHAYWDFTTNTKRSPAAMSVEVGSWSGTVGPGADLSVPFSQPPLAGTGSITLFDVTAGSNVEMFDVASDVVFRGMRIIISPTTPLTTDGHTYRLYIDAGAVVSAYGATLPEIADSSLEFSVILPNPIVASLVYEEKFGSGETNTDAQTPTSATALTLDPTRPHLLTVYSRSSSYTDPGMTITLGGVEQTYLQRKISTNVQIAVFYLPAGTGNGDSVSLSFGAAMNNSAFTVFELDDKFANIGASTTGGSSSGTSHSVSVTTTRPYSQVIVFVDVNNTTITPGGSETSIHSGAMTVCKYNVMSKQVVAIGAVATDWTVGISAASPAIAVELVNIDS